MAATQESYEAWVKFHGTMFGFTADDGPMLSLWVRHFAGEGFAAAELFAASRTLASVGAPSWRADHLRVLSQTMLAARKPESPPMPEDPRGTCTLCGSTGWVSVPHPYVLRGLIQKWPLFVVTCRCALGNWRDQRLREYFKEKKSKQSHMTLDAYQQEFPTWRDEADAQVKREEASRVANSVARERDTRFGGLIKRRLEKLTPPETEETF